MRFRTWPLRALFFVGGCVALVIAGALFVDAMSNALQPANAATGRVKGCYTFVDDLFRSPTPLAWARPLECALMLVLVGGAAFCFWRATRSSVSSARLIQA